MGRPRRIDLIIGGRYGHWTVLSEAAVRRVRSQSVRWAVARCDCGTVREVAVGRLARGDSCSCGCFARAEKRAPGASVAQLAVYVGWFDAFLVDHDRRERDVRAVDGLDRLGRFLARIPWPPSEK